MKTKVQLVHCHRMPSRSFFYKGRQFPVCARCTGVYIGYFLSLPFFLFYYLNIFACILLFIPVLVDGLTQAYCNRESNNYLRLITGLMSGVACAGICDFITYWFLRFVIFLIHLM